MRPWHSCSPALRPARRCLASSSCAADGFILDAALAAGTPLPSSCTQGICGICKCPPLEGEVEMNHTGGIRPREITAGKILICCSTPTGNMVIDA